MRIFQIGLEAVFLHENFRLWEMIGGMLEMMVLLDGFNKKSETKPVFMRIQFLDANHLRCRENDGFW